MKKDTKSSSKSIDLRIKRVTVRSLGATPNELGKVAGGVEGGHTSNRTGKLTD